MSKVDVKSVDKLIRRCLHVAKDVTKARSMMKQRARQDQPKLTLGEIRDIVDRRDDGGALNHPANETNRPGLTLGEIRDALADGRLRTSKPSPRLAQYQPKRTLGQIRDASDQPRGAPLSSSVRGQLNRPDRKTAGGKGVQIKDQQKLTLEQIRDWPQGENTRTALKPKSILSGSKMTFDQVVARGTGNTGPVFKVHPHMTIGQISNVAKARTRAKSTLSQPKITFGEVREIANENWERRCELATAYRSLAKYNMHEGVCNHLTVKAPSVNSDGYVIITAPYGIYWTDVTPQDLVAMDMETGELVEGRERPEITAQSIHLGMYRHRHDINCIIHTHARYSSILGTLKDPRVEMLHQTSTRFLENVAYDQDFPLMANQDSNEEGDRLGKVLGDREVLLMGHHGLTTIGRTVPMAFDLHYYFEKAAEIQVLAYQSGQPLKYLSDEVAQNTHAQMVDCQVLTSNAHFFALQDMLKREDAKFLSKDH